MWRSIGRVVRNDATFYTTQQCTEQKHVGKRAQLTDIFELSRIVFHCW